MDKLNFSKPEELQTRDGMSVRIYATDGTPPYIVHGAILRDGNWGAYRWNINGRGLNDYKETYTDLVRKPISVTGWVNLYENFGQLAPKFGDVLYESKQLAKENISSQGKCFGQIYINEEVQE